MGGTNQLNMYRGADAKLLWGVASSNSSTPTRTAIFFFACGADLASSSHFEANP